LRPGDLISHFEGATIDGHRVRYEQLWQRRNLVLFVLSTAVRAEAQSYLTALEERVSTLQPDDTTLVVCDDRIEHLPRDSVVIADRWGEIAWLQEIASNPAEWPSVDEIVEWVEFIRIKCPECPP